MNDDKYYYGLTSEKEIGICLSLHFLTFSISKFAHWYLSFADSATIIRPDSLKYEVKNIINNISIWLLSNSIFNRLNEKIFDQRFFRLLSECSQRKVSASEFAEAIEELATHVADFSITEQDYSILLRYFSFGLYRLKSYRVWFEQEKNILFASNWWSDRVTEYRNTPNRMAYQVPGTVAATHQQTSPFPSISRWQNHSYQYHGNS